jgi:hypothetical protein
MITNFSGKMENNKISYYLEVMGNFEVDINGLKLK